MNNSVSNKFAALGAALVINAILLGSVALLFNAHVPVAETLAQKHSVGVMLG